MTSRRLLHLAACTLPARAVGYHLNRKINLIRLSSTVEAGTPASLYALGGHPGRSKPPSFADNITLSHTALQFALIFNLFHFSRIMAPLYLISFGLKRSSEVSEMIYLYMRYH